MDSHFTEERWARLAEVNGVDRAKLEAAIEVFNALEWPNCYYYLDRDGNRLSLGEAMLLATDDEYRLVLETFVGDVRVSTAWMGWCGQTYLFETMVFAPDDRPTDGPWRCHTEFDATANHERAVSQLVALQN